MAERESLSKVAGEKIRGLILEGKLRPGERLIEDRLSAELGVSRVPVKTLFEYLEDNYSLEEFLACFPSVTSSLPSQTRRRRRQRTRDRFPTRRRVS